MRILFFRDPEKPHTGPVGLLFGKRAVYNLVGVDSDCFRLFAEVVAVPFQIFLMV